MDGPIVTGTGGGAQTTRRENRMVELFGAWWSLLWTDWLCSARWLIWPGPEYDAQCNEWDADVEAP